MIEVIKRGARIVTVCKNCGCKFSFEREDVYKKYTMIDMDRKYTRECVTCPQCNETLVISQTR